MSQRHLLADTFVAGFAYGQLRTVGTAYIKFGMPVDPGDVGRVVVVGRGTEVLTMGGGVMRARPLWIAAKVTHAHGRWAKLAVVPVVQLPCKMYDDGDRMVWAYPISKNTALIIYANQAILGVHRIRKADLTERYGVPELDDVVGAL